MRPAKARSALRSARARHRRLDEIIDRRQRLRLDDPYTIQMLKKQRLAAKDRVAGLAKLVDSAARR